MKSESLLALLIALFTAIITASPLPPTKNTNNTPDAIIGTDGRSGYNSVPADANAPIETDGRSGYNAVQPVPREGRSGYNGVVRSRSVAGAVETDGRSGYNGVEPVVPVVRETSDGGVGTDGRSGYN